jgi:hypothetical protein
MRYSLTRLLTLSGPRPAKPCPGLGVRRLGRAAVCPARRHVVGMACHGGPGVHQLLEGFPGTKGGERLGRNLDGGPRAWVAAGTRLAVAPPEASKAPQFHRLSRLERRHNGLQELCDDRVGFVNLLRLRASQGKRVHYPGLPCLFRQPAPYP